MKKLLSILFLLSPAVLFAQQNHPYMLEYNIVSPAELLETEYPFDVEAEAAVIFSSGEYKFVPYDDGRFKGFNLVMTFTQKIKIYNEAGLEYAKFEIPYLFTAQDPEEVDIKGTTYNIENGAIVRTELARSNIYTEQVRGEVYVKKVAFPNVRIGSVIELRYVISTQYFFNMRTWWFQQKIPVYRSVLRYRATPFFSYAFVARGLTRFDERTSEPPLSERQFGELKYREVDHVFAMNRMPAFRDEEFLPNTDDYMANVNFQLESHMSLNSGDKIDIMSTWPQLCEDMLKDAGFGKYVESSVKEAKEILPRLGLAGKSDLEKFEAIVAHVKGGYTWNNSVSTHARSKLSDFLKTKTGNSANLNLFMTGLMQAAGLEAYPVALSTHDNGVIYKDYPFTHYLNDVAAMAIIDGENYYADATSTLTRYDELPRRSTNVEGLIVRKKVRHGCTSLRTCLRPSSWRST